jgi:hypothetical protein
VVGREVSGVGTGVESADVSYNGRCGFCSTGGALSSALSFSVLEGGVSLTLGVASFARSSSCTCLSKYGPNVSVSTTLVCPFFNCSSYSPANSARTLSSSLSIQVKCTSDWYTAYTMNQRRQS